MEDADPGSTFRAKMRRLFKNAGTDDKSKEEEILKAVSEGHEQGELLDSEADMISNIFEFTDKEARDIMTHRNDIVGIDGNLTLNETVRFLMEENNSRFPVWTDSIDHIIGILHLRDILKAVVDGDKGDVQISRLKDLMREPLFVAETRNIDSLFRSMQAKKVQMVIVIDEYGQTAGLVTMEDMLEEIVGNIFDEYDEEEDLIRETPSGEYIIDGKAQLKDLEELLGISFEDEDCETLNGFLITRMDHIPADGEAFETDEKGYHFKVLSAGNHMILSVLVSKIVKAQEESE